MRKITLIVALLLGAVQAEAQVLVTENFDTALTWTVNHVSGSSANPGWTRVTNGTNPNCTPTQGTGMAKFDAYNIPAGNNYHIQSNAVNFTGANYRVKFSMYRDGGYPDNTDRIRVYYNTTTNPGGTLLGTVNRSTALAPAVPANGWYNYSFNLPANLTATGYISFMATSNYGNSIYIDNVMISQIAEDDAELSNLSIDVIAAQGNLPIAGAFKNMGLNTLSSVDLNWQVGGGEIHTQTLTDLNLAPNASYNFTHQDAWASVPGQYTISVWVSNPNGNTDSDDTNNYLNRTVSIASGSATRFPLYEKFSSSTCPPCAQFNGSYFNPFSEVQHDNFALINYQVNWPGTGDPYYTAEVGSRVSYYGVNAAPTLFVDSQDGTNFSTQQLNNDLTNAAARPAFFGLTAGHTITGNNISVDVSVMPYLTGTYTVHAVVVEKETYDNAASNGETEFHNVMMKMLPNPSGTVVDFVLDVPHNFELNAALTGLNIEEMGDLAVVVFIQNNETKAIMQAAYSDDLLAATQFESVATIKMLPNPTTGIVRVSSTKPVDVIISDVTGKVVLSQNAVTNNTPIDLSAFQTGIYMAKMISGNAQQTQKIILK
ncbi:T9SS-dependent choice-of-anchor J family protein [Flavobacterium caeni]|uniref:Por secretion system C-terminal sorting domain-containing protein n=1 Tax=Flavobacterium caeni TaxID=490189 RepID=A0A1G5IP58_9FLAO|nr:T9SS type A sorting domain-containing protein [Flavobacterium caeni]SCY77369.1 Por secretion system C-terminal sorting domain-containing protein [Flavobacterium caeni]